MLAVVAVAVGVAIGCGGGGSSSSGVAGDKTVASLTIDEKKTMCDWAAGLWGGYDKEVDCGGGLTVHNDKSQGECLQHSFSTCNAKVSALEACLSAIFAVKCSDAAIPPACASLPIGCNLT